MTTDSFLVLDDEPSERTKPVRVYNPSGFDPKAHLPEALHKHADAVRHLLHTIHHNRFMYRRRPDEFIEIKAAYMRPFFRPKDDYKPVVEALKTSGVLECDGHYAEGLKCLGFRLGPALREAQFVASTVTDRSLVRKVSIRREKQRQGVTWDVHRHLLRLVEQVDFDRKAAAEFVADNGFEDQQIALDGFEHRDFFFVPCPYGRVHTNITSLKSELRRFLSFKGEKLVNLDIRNSQPLLFSIVLLNYLVHEGSLDGLYNWRLDDSKLYYDLNSISSLFQEQDGEPSPSLFSNAPLRCPALITGEGEGEDCGGTTRRLLSLGLPEDVLRYIDLVQRGEFYEHLMAEGDIPSHRRKTFKASFFGGVFFCKNRPVTRQADLFRRLFPNVYKVVTEIKAKDHSRLAHILQRVESSLIVNRVARRCMDDLPETFVATIHDSILTTEDAADTIMAIMRREFAKVGLVPTIRVEDLGEIPARASGRPVAARS